MTKIEQTQVLIAGGGPVGLLAAVCAARRGLDVIVFERSFRGTPRGHATLLHPSSMRLLAELGLAPLLLRSGQLIEQIELRVSSHTLLLKLPFPAVIITQSVFEEALLQVVRKEEIDLRAPCEVVAIAQREQHVEVRVARSEQVDAAALRDQHWELADSSLIHTQFVIGADGRTSHVMQSLGIRAACSPAERYAMFEVPSDHPLPPTLVISGKHSHFMSPLVDRRARYSFQLDPTAKATADLSLLATLLAEHAPQQEAPIELYWSAIVDFEPGVAEAFGKDRVWLAGDAAHTASPLGVQSMNRGLVEAWQLVEAMAAVSAGKLQLNALELLGNAQRGDWLATLTNDSCFELLARAPGWLSDHARQVVSALPASGLDLQDLLGQLGLAGRSPV